MGKTQLGPFRETTLYENSNAKPLEQEKHFTLKERTSRRGQLHTEGCPCGSLRPLARSLPAEVTHQKGLPDTPSKASHPLPMKPDLGAPSTTSVLGDTSRQPHAPSSSFTCANTADAALPFPAQTAQEIPTNSVLPLPRAPGSRPAAGAAPHPVQRVPRAAFPLFQDGFHGEGGASGSGGTGRASSFRFPAGAGRPEPPLGPGGPAPPQHPGPRAPGAGRVRRPSRPPAAAARQPRGRPRPTAVPA